MNIYQRTPVYAVIDGGEVVNMIVCEDDVAADFMAQGAVMEKVTADNGKRQAVAEIGGLFDASEGFVAAEHRAVFEAARLDGAVKGA